jgi:hypothetical protein
MDGSGHVEAPTDRETIWRNSAGNKRLSAYTHRAKSVDIKANLDAVKYFSLFCIFMLDSFAAVPHL